MVISSGGNPCGHSAAMRLVRRLLFHGRAETGAFRRFVQARYEKRGRGVYRPCVAEKSDCGRGRATVRFRRIRCLADSRSMFSCRRSGERAEKRFPVRIFDPGRTSDPLWFSCMRVPGDWRTGKSVGTALDGAALGLFRFPVFVFPARRSCRGGILWAIRSGALLWGGQRSCGAEVVAVFRYFVVGRGFERRAV